MIIYIEKSCEKIGTVLYFFKQLSKISYVNIDIRYYNNLILIFKMLNENFYNYISVKVYFIDFDDF